MDLTQSTTDVLHIYVDDPEVVSYIIRYHSRELPVEPVLEKWQIIWRCEEGKTPCQRDLPRDQTTINVDWEWLRADMKSGWYSLVLQVFNGQWLCTELSPVYIVVPDIP